LLKILFWFLNKDITQGCYLKVISHWLYLEQVDFEKYQYAIENPPKENHLFWGKDNIVPYIKEWEIYPVKWQFSTSSYLDLDDKYWNYEIIGNLDVESLILYSKEYWYTCFVENHSLFFTSNNLNNAYELNVGDKDIYDINDYSDSQLSTLISILISMKSN